LEHANSDYRYETPTKKLRKLGDSDNGAVRASEMNRLPIVTSAHNRAESDGVQSCKDCDLKSQKSNKSSRSHNIAKSKKRKHLQFDVSKPADLDIDSQETLSNFRGLEYGEENEDDNTNIS
jgi:hypothetical protein